jgi:glycosyltransferase involved in cell wall biosynthesis
MANPLVSVALATYNGEAFLEEQLESILNQDYQPMEILVSDDFSTDRTPFILQRYAEVGKIKYFRNVRNLGYVKNFEKVISYCSGQYIALADQDDIWNRTKISRLVQSIGGNLLIHSDAVLIDQNGLEIAKSFSEFSKKMSMPQSLTEVLINGSVTGCTSLFKRELVDEVLPFPDRLYVHDKWIGVIAFLKNGFTYLHEPLTSYRQHLNNSIGVAQTSISVREKISKIFSKSKTNPQFQVFRNALEKEKLFVTEVRIRALKNGSAKNEVFALENFYSQVLEGKNLFSIFKFYWMNFDAFEKNKSVSQKLYYFYLILNAFFYSKRLQYDISETTNSLE